MSDSEVGILLGGGRGWRRGNPSTDRLQVEYHFKGLGNSAERETEEDVIRTSRRWRYDVRWRMRKRVLEQRRSWNRRRRKGDKSKGGGIGGG